MTTTPSNATGRRRKGGLGGLLTSAPEPVEVTEGQEAIDLPGEIPPAPDPAARPAPTRRPVPGVVLPRSRRPKEPTEKMTVAVPLAVFTALDELLERDGTLRKNEVTEALRTHLRAKGIDIEEG